RRRAGLPDRMDGCRRRLAGTGGSGHRRLPVGLAGKPGDGGGQGRAARAERRPAVAERAGRDDSGAGATGAGAARVRMEQLQPRPRDCAQPARDPIHEAVQIMTSSTQALRVGIGGPVGSGKTALTLALCRALRDKYNIAVVTNDIYTAEDAQFLVRNEALAADRIIGVETGGCPHTAIREDASINLEAVDRLNRRF